MAAGAQSGNAIWMASEFSTQMARVMTAMTSEPAQVEYRETTSQDFAALAEPGTVYWRHPLQGLSQASFVAAAPKATWFTIGAEVSKAAEATQENAESAFFEIVAQSLTGLCQSVTARLRHQVIAEQGTKCDAVQGAEWHCIRIGESGAVLLIELGSLSTAIDSLEKSEMPMRQPITTPLPGSKSMDLLLDVELPVSVSFGRTQLPLKDVLKFTSGSIIELNRAVSEPVEVIINNCVIARGEVVVIEGNYGVRITGIISRQERLRTLK